MANSQQTQDRPPAYFDEVPMAPMMPAPINPGAGTNVQAFSGAITAQKVAEPRNEMAIMKKIEALANSEFGDELYYSWEVNDKRKGPKGKSEVSGITIKGANALMYLWKNCTADCRAEVGPTHTDFLARFVDLEAGVSVTRPFRQTNPKQGERLGRMDAERTADLRFQIGASKATRNAIRAALTLFADYMVECAKKGIMGRIEKDPKKARTAIENKLIAHNVTKDMAEAYLEAPYDKWVNRHLVRLYQAMKAIESGDATVDDIFNPGAVQANIDNQDGTDDLGGEGQGEPEQQQSQDAPAQEQQPAEPDKAAGKKKQQASAPKQDPKPAPQADSAPAPKEQPKQQQADSSPPAAEPEEEPGLDWLQGQG